MSRDLSSSRALLEEIATRASTPPDRQAWDIQERAKESDAKVQARIKHLSFIMDINDEAQMQQFLAWHHLEQEQLTEFLSTPARLTGPLPDWIDVLERVSKQPKSDMILDRCLQPDAPFPFEEVLLPFLREARRQYQVRMALSPSLLKEREQVTLERWLLRQLCNIAGNTLQFEFAQFRKRYDFLELSSKRCELYKAFIAQYHGEGLLPFFREYSVLARLLVLLVEQWVDASTEFVQRLEADWDTIEKQLFEGQSLGSVVQVSPGHSDCHHQGRTVFLVTFATGVKVVYKPRCLAGDQAFADLLRWGNTQGLLPLLKPVRVLSRPTYGWAECITQQPCTSQKEVETYYLKIGALLGWLYLLGGADMHSENLIASGEEPVLVDLEAVISPGFPPSLFQKEAWEISSLQDECLLPKHSVLKTGMLPEWPWIEKINMAYDRSGIGGVEQHQQLKPCRVWKHINTDAMDQETVQRTSAMSLNTVLLQDTVVNPLEHREEVVQGFRMAYHFLWRHASDLLAPDGPLNAFLNCSFRFVRNDTQLYGEALEILTKPSFLREGTDRWIELQVFANSLLQESINATSYKIAEAEVFALQCLDIPWFGTLAGSRDLWLDTGEILPNVFPSSALEQARACLAELDEVDLARQSHLIRTAFQIARPTKGKVQEKFPPLAEEQAQYEVLSPNDLITIACQIAQELKVHAYNDLFMQQNGTWMGLLPQESGDAFQQRPVEFDLYEGASGIALFLAALERITGEHTFRDLITAAMHPLCQKVKDAAASPDAPLASWKIGAASGLGGWIYALSRIGTWLDLPELLEAACNTAHLLTKERVSADQSFDVIGGSAGALLGILSLYSHLQKDDLLEQAQWCGQQLLEHRVETEAGRRAWPAFQAHPLTGFSHGAAGIAYALLRLTEATGNSVWKEAAEEALAFEQSLFLPAIGNWPDLRKQETEVEAFTPLTWGTAWCHGATGIGLARLGGLTILDTPQIRADLAVALQTTQKAGLQDIDTLCCGNFGRIELLVATAQRLEQPPLLKIAREWSSIIVGRAREHKGFRVLAPLPRSAYHPGLFQGYAGIGYQLLRIACPDQIPSILLWE